MPAPAARPDPSRHDLPGVVIHQHPALALDVRRRRHRRFGNDRARHGRGMRRGLLRHGDAGDERSGGESEQGAGQKLHRFGDPVKAKKGGQSTATDGRGRPMPDIWSVTRSAVSTSARGPTRTRRTLRPPTAVSITLTGPRPALFSWSATRLAFAASENAPTWR